MAEQDDMRQSILVSFSFLLDQYGFSEEFFDKRYGLYGRGFLLGIGSSNCRFLFVKEPECKHIYIRVGSTSAPYQEPDASGPQNWFSLPAIIHFLSGNAVIIDDRLTWAEMLDYLANRLRPLTEAIIKSFRNRNAIETWLSRYEDFIGKLYISNELP